MDEFEVEYKEDDEGVFVSKRVIPADLAVLGLGLARDLSACFARFFDIALHLAGNHADYQTNQRLFQQEAAIEIETLTSGDQDG